jgi:autotransporter-associated beta strand protein
LFAAPISGKGTLTKLGTGSLTLTGSNTYSGGTILTGGKLIVASPSALPDGSNLSIGSGLSLFGPSGDAVVADPMATPAPSVAPTADSATVPVPEPSTRGLVIAIATGTAAFIAKRRKTRVF